MIAYRILDLSDDRGLLAPETFTKATDEERDEICNGAGVEGFNVPDSFLGCSITRSANIHDWMCHFSKSHGDRQFADVIFFINMVLQIMDVDIGVGFWKKRKTYLRLKMAIIYFIAVWRFGATRSYPSVAS